MKRIDTFTFILDENDKYVITVDGLFMYKNNRCKEESIKHFIIDFHNLKQDFNDCYGAYRIKIEHATDTIYFGDNSGMIRFYINQSKEKIFSSMLQAEKEKDHRIPNYSAIAQFLLFGCVYGYETIFKDVFLSNPNYYYIMRNNKIIEKSKKLKSLDEYKKDKTTLSQLILQAIDHCDTKVGCTITGGIDSRAVLANLIELGVKPHLAITGQESHIDVEIAKSIASKTGLELSIISDDIDEDNWLDYCIDAADGQTGICEIYRLNKLSRYLENNGIGLQFGGVAGEMYKNSFINQDFPFYYGKPKWNRFYKYKIATFDFPTSLMGEKLREEYKKLNLTIIEWLKMHKGRNKAETYLNAGYEIMQARCNLVINMFEKHTILYNPLMERKMASYAYGENPYALEMQAFQRKEVSQHCSKIKNIKTDRGLTGNYNRRAMEFFRSYLFLVKVASQRIFFRNKIDTRIDRCYIKGHKHKSYAKAIKTTQKLGILGNNIDINSLPPGIADRLFTIGLLFE